MLKMLTGILWNCVGAIVGLLIAGYATNFDPTKMAVTLLTMVLFNQYCIRDDLEELKDGQKRDC